MKRVLFALAISFIVLTSFSTAPVQLTGCRITVVEITRYPCGDVYEGSTTLDDPNGNCGSQTLYDVTTNPGDGVCTHDHSAPPDGLK